MDKRRPFLHVLAAAFAYGFGLLLGNVVSYTLFKTVSPDRFLSGNQAVRLLQGILLAFFISGLGGFVGGALGGLSLPAVGLGKSRRRYAWRSGVTFAVGYGLLVFPLVLVASLLSFYDISHTPAAVFAVAFAAVGLLFGALMGLSLGLWTVGRRFPPVTRGSAVGFALGGALLGYGLWRYILSVNNGVVETGAWAWLLVGLFCFGALGGGSLGYAYQRTAARANDVLSPQRNLTRRRWRRRWTFVGVALVSLALLSRPLLAAVGDLLTPIDATLSPVLGLETTGTDWLDATAVAQATDAQQPALAAGANGRLGLAWVQGGALLFAVGQWSSVPRQTRWETPQVVAANSRPAANSTPAAPQVAAGEGGRFYLAWIGEDGVNVTTCAATGCRPPATIAAPATCSGAPAQAPTLAFSDGTLLLLWANAGGLPFAVWAADERPPATASGCGPAAAGAATPRLAASGNSAFALVFAQADGAIAAATYENDAWSTPTPLGDGRLPTIGVDADGRRHAAWCGAADDVVYWREGETETVAGAPCRGRPAIAFDDAGQAHLVWHSDAVVNSDGRRTPHNLLYESVRADNGWMPAAIIGRNSTEGQAALAGAADGSLHLAWADGTALNYAAQAQYRCDPPADLSAHGRILYAIARDPAYAPAQDPVPYCNNRYDRLLFTPNPEPGFSEQPPTPNGAFDALGDLIRGAQYEVLLSTMWYDAATNHDSPGSVIAAAVADLYASVKADPARYPRGMTVRILLDNPPELALGETTGQLWSLLGDLRHAGIVKMVDDEIGWRLQVADYEGQLPHSHVKTVIVDGKTAVAAGFNMTYDHLPLDHRSGQGGGRFDVGLQITGPAAQAALRAFDDMWEGADERYCTDFSPPFNVPWQVLCFDRSATADHAPEVLKFYLPDDGRSPAFSLYRSKVHDQADRQNIATLAAARQSIDIVHVNFALEMVCNLNVLFEICTVDNAPDYMPALLQAAQNGAHVRILVKPGPFEGIENHVAIHAFAQRVAELGLTDRVEIRYFDGPMHPKVAVVDKQLLIVGSQNYHYSAFGAGGGLNEYSFAVEDPQAVHDFGRVFEYLWQRPQNAAVLPP